MNPTPPRTLGLRNVSSRVLTILARSLPVLLAVGFGFWFGTWMSTPPSRHGPDDDHTAATTDPHAGHAHAGAASGNNDNTDGQAVVWTCSMDPQVRQGGPGKCPICGMDLIPVKPGQPGEITLSAAQLKRAGIRTARVKHAAATSTRRMTGQVKVDETRVGRVTAWYDARIESMIVDTVGAKVQKGDRLLTLYSPELLLAQKELLEAVAQRDRLAAQADALPALSEASGDIVAAARERLRLWGMSRYQIDLVVKRKRPLKTLTVRAPRSGIVVARSVKAGEWVKTGSPLFSIADLDRVWVDLDAYEEDLAYLKLGLRVRFETRSEPGVARYGDISFISPIIDPQTRTATIRLDARGTDAHGVSLRPGAYVEARITAALSDATPLVIPHSAPLITGERAIVFVVKPHSDPVSYRMRPVTLGARTAAGWVVTAGLKAGEDVVVEGAFQLDSALQLRGEPSLMNSGDDARDAPADVGALKSGLAAAINGIDRETNGLAQPVADQALAELRATVLNGAHTLHLLRGPSAWLSEVVSDRNRRAAWHQLVSTARSIVGPNQPLPRPTAPTRSGNFQQRLEETIAASLVVSKHLGDDNLATSISALPGLVDAVSKLVSDDAPTLPPALSRGRDAIAKAIAEPSPTIASLRASYGILNAVLSPLSQQLIGHSGATWQLTYCPMVDDDTGAFWLQAPGPVHNPYFGAEMLQCGVEVETNPAPPASDNAGGH